MGKTKKLTISAIYIALYIVAIALTSSISFGAVQIRLANMLYALAFCYPFLILPAGISVMLSNIVFGGLGLPDMLGGFLVAVTTTFIITLIKRFNWSKLYIIPTVIIVPSMLVPIWLSVLLNLPYWPLVLSLMLGHILPSIMGYLLVSGIDKIESVKEDVNE